MIFIKSIIVKEVTKEKFEEIKQKYPNCIVSKRKNGTERIFIGKKVFVLKS